MLRQILFLFLSFFVIINLQVFAQWTNMTKFPGTARDGAFSFTIGDTAYFGGGITPVPLQKDFWKFDETSGWTRLADLPAGPRGWAYAFSINGKGYVGGGDSTGNFNPTSDFWEYDPATNSWIQKANFGGGNKDGAFCFVLNGKAYVGAGFNGTYVMSDFWQYDPQWDQWNSMGNYDGGAVIFPCSFIINNKAYVGCGNAANGMDGTNLFYEYNDTKNTWKQCQSFPGSLRGAEIGFAVNNKGYIGLGEVQYTTIYQDFYEYDPSKDSWTLSSNLTYPDTHAAWATSFVLGNDAYICTGATFTTGIEVSNYFYKYSFPATSVNDELKNSDNSNIYPNPASNILFIKGSPNQTIKIYSIEGIKILETKNTGKIELNGFENGLYIITINDKAYKFTVYR